MQSPKLNSTHLPSPPPIPQTLALLSTPLSSNLQTPTQPASQPRNQSIIPIRKLQSRVELPATRSTCTGSGHCVVTLPSPHNDPPPDTNSTPMPPAREREREREPVSVFIYPVPWFPWLVRRRWRIWWSCG
ncbi:hypothetical protein KC19_4G173600 [Ceratodon purpureus]|uniref:Uncharacterized protein n=1 Tax=Ceratodon purpureus TaxID=3225 RepID=A0A8T0IAJ4_CERPU|nr:hypothetical protein KC19_4G173600 [Ceratodon purpureus]